MSLNDDIKMILQQVPGTLGLVWQYRTRTNDRDVTPPTWGAWIDVAGLALDHRRASEDTDNGDEIIDAMMIRVPSTATIKVGDQMKSPETDNPIYHVQEQVGSGIGTDRWLIERAKRSIFGDQREGGFN